MAELPEAPSIAVVIPLFNGEEFIADALRSLAAQTLPVTEVLVVDDGSTDGGPGLVADSELPIKLVRQENSGVAVARNRGMANATTEFIAFLDQDDIWHPRHLELASATLARDRIVLTGEQCFATVEDAQAGWTGGGFGINAYLPASDIATELLVKDVLPLRQDAKARKVDSAELLRGPVALTTSFVVDRELAISAGGFPTHARSADDYLFMLNVSRLQPITLVDRGSHYYRVRPTSTFRTVPRVLPFLSAVIAARFGGILSEPGDVDRLTESQPHIDHAIGQLLSDSSTTDPVRRVAVAFLASPPSRRMRWLRLAARQLITSRGDRGLARRGHR